MKPYNTLLEGQVFDWDEQHDNFLSVVVRFRLDQLSINERDNVKRQVGQTARMFFTQLPDGGRSPSLIHKRVLVGRGRVIADCTTNEAAEAALRLLK